MAAVPAFALGIGQTPGQVLYSTIANNARDGFLTNVSALLPSGADAKRMDKPKQPGRSKHKFVETVVINGQTVGGTPMSYVASDNYNTYALAAQLLGSADGKDYSSYLTEFARLYGTGKIQSSKGKVVGKGFIDIPPEWKSHGNAVATSSLTPKSPAKATVAQAVAGPVAGFTYQ